MPAFAPTACGNAVAPSERAAQAASEPPPSRPTACAPTVEPEGLAVTAVVSFTLLVGAASFYGFPLPRGPTTVARSLMAEIQHVTDVAAKRTPLLVAPSGLRGEGHAHSMPLSGCTLCTTCAFRSPLELASRLWQTSAAGVPIHIPAACCSPVTDALAMSGGRGSGSLLAWSCNGLH